MDIEKKIRSLLKPELAEQVLKHSTLKTIPKGEEFLREQQYIKSLPLVMDGLVKVYSRFQDKELLLYYIAPAQSCVMTFYAALKNTPSRIFAVAEEESTILFLPTQYMPQWMREYPDFNELFFNQFSLRYSELLDTIGHLLIDKMDKRVYDHLKKKAQLRHGYVVKMSHQEIANELGTAREVVTRMIKKLELDGKIAIEKNGIKILAVS